MNIKYLSYFVLFALLSSIFLPPIQILGLTLYFTTIFSPIVLLISLVLSKVYFVKFNIILILLCIMVFISSLYSNALGYSSYSIRNYIEAIKYLQYLPYLLYLSLLMRINTKIFEKVLDFLTLIFILISFVMVFDIVGLKSSLLNLYLDSNSPHYEKSIDNWRLTLTGAGPNEGGIIAVFLYLYNLLKLINYKKYLYSINIFLLIYLILMTQSRTALIGMVLTSCLIFLFIRGLSLISKISILSLFFFIIYIVFSYIELDYIKVGFELTLSGDNESLNIRQDRWDVAKEIFYSSPIFGVGPAKNELSTIIDSEYALILQRYGIFGLISFSILIFNLFIFGFRYKNEISGQLLIFYTFLTLIVMFTNNAYSGYQLMSISIFLILWIFCKNQLGYKHYE